MRHHFLKKTIYRFESEKPAVECIFFQNGISVVLQKGDFSLETCIETTKNEKFDEI